MWEKYFICWFVNQKDRSFTTRSLKVMDSDIFWSLKICVQLECLWVQYTHAYAYVYPSYSFIFFRKKVNHNFSDFSEDKHIRFFAKGSEYKALTLCEISTWSDITFKESDFLLYFLLFSLVYFGKMSDSIIRITLVLEISNLLKLNQHIKYYPHSKFQSLKSWAS